MAAFVGLAGLLVEFVDKTTGSRQVAELSIRAMRIMMDRWSSTDCQCNQQLMLWREQKVLVQRHKAWHRNWCKRDVKIIDLGVENEEGDDGRIKVIDRCGGVIDAIDSWETRGSMLNHRCMHHRVT